MIQAHQPTWCVDSWPYYEFEDYIKILNDRNEEERKNREESEKSGSLSSSTEYKSMMRNFGKFSPGSFKPPNFKMPK